VKLRNYRTAKKITFTFRVGHLQLMSEQERSPPAVEAEFVNWKFKKKFDLGLRQE
jgi:hypothetical protein